MRTEGFANKIPQKTESREAKLHRIQLMVNQIAGKMSSTGNNDPRLVEALASLLQVLQSMKAQG
jgi:hypothetical protein